MRRAGGPRGIPAALAALIVVGFSVVAPVQIPLAFAQAEGGAGERGGDVAAARECAALSSDVARLACYDALLGPGEAAAQPGAAQPPEPQSSTSRRGGASVEAERGTEVEADAETSDPEASDAEALGAEAEADPVAAPPPRPRPARASAIEPVEIEPYSVTVIEIPRLQPDAVFVTEDGEVWVQTDARRVTVPDVPFVAEIRPGILGSYFLAPRDGGRAIRVRLQ